MPRKVTVVRCPECGSTDAGEDEDDTRPFAPGLWVMRCRACGHQAWADHYEIKDDWNVEIELADDAKELPKKVPVH